MTYSKQKLLQFKQSIFKEIDFEIEKMQEMVSNYEHVELKSIKDKKLNEIFIYMQKEVKNLNLSYEKKVSKKKLELKNEVLVFRNELINNFYLKCRNSLQNFTKTKSYGHFFKKSVEKFSKQMNLNGSKFKIRSVDMNFKKKILSVAKFSSVEIDEENELGGFKIFLPEQKILIDNTLNTLFETEFNRFRSSCELALNTSEMR